MVPQLRVPHPRFKSETYFFWQNNFPSHVENSLLPRLLQQLHKVNVYCTEKPSYYAINTHILLLHKSSNQKDGAMHVSMQKWKKERAQVSLFSAHSPSFLL